MREFREHALLLTPIGGLLPVSISPVMVSGASRCVSAQGCKTVCPD